MKLPFLISLLFSPAVYAPNEEAGDSELLTDGTQFNVVEGIQGANVPHGPLVHIDAHIESHCPDTTKFLKQQLLPVFNELNEFIDLKLIPFGKANWTELDNGQDYNFQCQHGPKECWVNQLMCCGIERLKSPDQYLPYIVCVQGTLPYSIHQVKCDQDANLAHNDMQRCANGRQGRLLHQRMGELTQELHPPMHSIPWVLIDGKPDKRAVKELKRVVCEKINHKPKTCEFVQNNGARDLAFVSLVVAAVAVNGITWL